MGVATQTESAADTAAMAAPDVPGVSKVRHCPRAFARPLAHPAPRPRSPPHARLCLGAQVLPCLLRFCQPCRQKSCTVCVALTRTPSAGGATWAGGTDQTRSAHWECGVAHWEREAAAIAEEALSKPAESKRVRSALEKLARRLGFERVKETRSGLSASRDTPWASNAWPLLRTACVPELATARRGLAAMSAY